jgi:hypothetical protein
LKTTLEEIWTMAVAGLAVILRQIIRGRDENAAVHEDVFVLSYETTKQFLKVLETKTPWLLVGIVSANFADRGCRVVSATDSHGS